MAETLWQVQSIDKNRSITIFFLWMKHDVAGTNSQLKKNTIIIIMMTAHVNVIKKKKCKKIKKKCIISFPNQLH